MHKEMGLRIYKTILKKNFNEFALLNPKSYCEAVRIRTMRYQPKDIDISGIELRIQ